MEPGGRADKLGNEYERLWIAKQLLLMLAGESVSVLAEGLGPDERGVDLWVCKPDGTREGHQCKRENQTIGKWSISALKGNDILGNLAFQLSRSDIHRFVFVSSDSAPLLEDLIERTTRCNDNPNAFAQYGLTSIGHKVAFREFCECLGLSSELDADIAKAFDLLKRTSFASFPRPNAAQREVERLARLYVNGNASSVVSNLARMAIESIGNELSAADVRTYLRNCGHQPKDLIGDPSVHQAIERLQERFAKPLKTLLAGGQLIERDETSQIHAALKKESGPRVLVLHGDAGNGKTGVLFDLIHRLNKENVPYLPLRLDRQSPKVSPDQYGKGVCGLPSSPAHCLKAFPAGKQAVLILDQLDAIRWTSLHSAEAMDVFEELVEESLAIPNIRIVVACRKFDMDDHPRIKLWKSDKEALEVSVNALTDSQVSAVVQRLSGNIETLGGRQRSLLRTVQNLYLWAMLQKAGRTPAVFDNATDLMRLFWKEIRERAIECYGVTTEELFAFRRAIVGFMDSHGRLTCPISILEQWPRLLNILQSFDVLKRLDDDDTVVFSHQSYFDFLLAEHLRESIIEHRQTVVSWLKSNEQSLFRREQLRLLLYLLRDVETAAYYDGIREIIDGSDIRFHLKHLVLSFLGALQSPSPKEVDYVCCQLNNDRWHEHFYSNVVWRRPVWFHAIDDRGIILAWLESAEEDLVRRSLGLMGVIHEHIGDRIAEILEPCESDAAPWAEHLSQFFTYGDIHEDSDRLFALRLRLMQRGIYGQQFVYWDKLAEHHPARVIQLLAIHSEVFARSCEAHVKCNGKTVDLPVLDPELISHSEHFLKAADQEPLQAWRAAAFGIERLEGIVRLVKEYEAKERYEELLAIFERMLATSGGRLIREDASVFKSLAGEWASTSSKAIQRSLLISWECGDEHSADSSINWLCDSLSRFDLGTENQASRFEPARRLIERHSPTVTDKTLKRLERVILGWHDSEAWRRYKQSLKSGHLSDGGYSLTNEVGLAQFVLLSAAPVNRLSQEAVSALDAGRRKFGRLPTAREHFDSGWIRSSIPEEVLHRITDAQWLQIMRRNWRTRSRKWRPVKGGFREASHEQFARSIRQATHRNPQRFARLAVHIPEDASIEYMRCILQGLAEENPPSGIEDEEKKAWHPATDQELADVLLRVGFSVDIELGREFCRVVGARPTAGWPKEVRKLLVRYAAEHPDPKADEKPYYRHSGKHPHYKKISEYGDRAITCVRGGAGVAIRRILLVSPEQLPEFEAVLGQLATDASPFVRVASVAACVPLLNIDRKDAVRLFLAATDYDDDAILDTRQVAEFLRWSVQSQFDALTPILDRMVGSDLDHVAQCGAEWTTLAWLYDGKRESVFLKCFTGKVAWRRGVAKVAAHSINDKTIPRGVVEILETLLDDDDKEVREAASSAILQDGVLQRPEGKRLAHKLVGGDWFRESARDLVMCLDLYSGHLADYAEVLLTLCERLKKGMHTEELSSSHMFRLPKVLLRLYQDTYEDRDREVHVKCLDMWDALLSSRIGNVDAELAKI